MRAATTPGRTGRRVHGASGDAAGGDRLAHGERGRGGLGSLTALTLERQANDAAAAHTMPEVVEPKRSAAAGGRVRTAPQEDSESLRSLTDRQWSDLDRDGFLRLGKVLTPDELETLRQRA